MESQRVTEYICTLDYKKTHWLTFPLFMSNATFNNSQKLTYSFFYLSIIALQYYVSFIVSMQ